jgi:hypothetical protein
MKIFGLLVEGNAIDGVPLLKKAILIDEKQNSMYLEHDRMLLQVIGEGG